MSLYFDLYGVEDPEAITDKNSARSVSSSNDEIMKWITALYCPNGFDCDVTYSTGNFYKRINPPAIKLDLIPQTQDTIAADVQALPLQSESLNNVVFDPPFLAGSKADGKDGIMKKRFGIYKTVPALWKMYQNALVELYRVLKPEGVLIFKCQDTVESGLNFFTHCKVMNDAITVGFYPLDMFVLTAENRPLRSGQKTQKHARKFHSYFWVLKKTEFKIKY